MQTLQQKIGYRIIPKPAPSARPQSGSNPRSSADAQDLKVFLQRAAVDMRAGRHGLAVLVREAMRLDV